MAWTASCFSGWGRGKGKGKDMKQGGVDDMPMLMVTTGHMNKTYRD